MDRRGGLAGPGRTGVNLVPRGRRLDNILFPDT